MVPAKPARQGTHPKPAKDAYRAPALAFVTAVGLTVIFWGPLWEGGGLIGGDLYTYFFPQKVYYAAHLQQGELPFWNNLAGHGSFDFCIA